MFKSFASNRIVLFDGAMGTSIQKVEIPDNIWQGKNGCNEFLNIAYPEVIYNIHKNYFNAGADVAVTNTFGAIESVLDEYGIGDKVEEINRKAVEIAKSAAKGMDNKFVALSIGPGTKLASLGHTSYKSLYNQYKAQVASGIEADIFIIETTQDLLQIKAAINACKDIDANKPIIVSFTVEQSNTLLTGSDISSVACLMRNYDIFALGLNCAMGPDMMKAPLSLLNQHWNGRLYLSSNAGLPETIDGCTVYPMDSEKFKNIMDNILDEFPISATGGCCGTDTTHIKAMRQLIDSKPLKQPNNYNYTGEASSLYTTQSLIQNPAPALIGERANATGSKAFREMLLSDNIDGILSLCKSQEDEGAHFIDLSLAYAGRNELDDYINIIPVVNKILTAPLVIDSTDPVVVEASLERYSGKPIINSVNLEDGGEKLHKMFNIIKKHPACMVALTIDEKGMAQTYQEKVSIAERLYNIWVNDYGFSPEDLIIDTLTFSIGSGDETLIFAASETLKAIKEIKSRLKGVKTTLGVSNVSFGLSPSSRIALNSVFLSEAVKAGLDTAIVHASKVMPISSLSDKDVNICLNLIYGKDNALSDFISHFSNIKQEEVKIDKSIPADVALSQKIEKGDKTNLQELIDELSQTIKPVDIINNILFPAMQKVGELFGAGKMLLPFVLQSAETMKAAVTIIEPKLEKIEGTSKGDIVLATVMGDVHDIGKNLVDIIMSNNGFKVHNLGIKVPVSEMIKKAIEVNASAIGMSGLLVKSTQIMKENIEEIAKVLPNTKIMLGGAALTEKFVNENCANIMENYVYYCRDAFDNIAVMDNTRKPAGVVVAKENNTNTQNKDIVIDNISVAEIPLSPFFGAKVLDNVDLEEVLTYLNKASLFTSSWGYKKGKTDDTEYNQLLKETIIPEYNQLKERIVNENAMELKAIYGYFKVRRSENSLILYNNDEKVVTFDFPIRKKSPIISLAHYFSDDKDKFDIMPIQIVTLGENPVSFCQKLFKGDNYKNYYMAHGFFTELTEAFAEYIHAKIRKELNIHHNDSKTIDGILSGKYQGKRYSFGYPMTPDTENNKVVAKILGADRIGVTINSTNQMMPEYTTSAIIVHHSQATY